MMRRWNLFAGFALALLVLSACGPSPTTTDATVSSPESGWSDTGSDAGQLDSATTDSAVADSATPDTTQPDAAVGDSAVADSASPDSASSDSAAPDTAQPDSAQLDSAPADATVFYGPYAASGLPKIINDATGGSSELTMGVISVPSALTVDFADVHVEIAHGDSGDLLVELVPVQGAGEVLYNGDSCSSGCDANVVIDQRVNVYGPTNGNWVLRITDRYPSQSGVLQSFTINFVP